MTRIRIGFFIRVIRVQICGVYNIMDHASHTIVVADNVKLSLWNLIIPRTQHAQHL